MGKDKTKKAGGGSYVCGGGGLAAALGGAVSSPSGPSLLSAVLGNSSLDGEAQ